MERRGCSLGCIILLLGLVLSCCLLPYLVSSTYSLIGSLLQTSTASTWLWGDWINSIVESDTPLYMLLAEGPICCVGIVALLIVILGVVLMIGSMGEGEEYYEEEEDYEENEYEPYEG
jgi:hypothetical protein